MEKIAKQIGQFLTQLHSININKFKDLLNIDVNKHYTFEDGYIKYTINQYKKIENKFSKEVFKKIIRFIEESKNYKIYLSTLTHYDFWGKNIIISKEKNNINLIERTIYYKNKNLIFTLPEIFQKNGKLEHIKKVEELIKN